MMECSLIYTHLVLVLLLLFSSSSLTLLSLGGTESMVVAPSKERRCRDDEKAALLQFKHSFVIHASTCNRYWSYDGTPKVESWKEGVDCCGWDGVECDDRTHHVVELDLSGGCLFGSINANSSAHQGLEVDSLEGLVQHMINLKELHLSHVKISSSPLPQDLLSNFSSLESLLLPDCELRGEFPVAIFHLPKLKVLDLRINQDLRGYLPDFPSGSPLQSLLLFFTSFGGVVPPSIENLASLEHIDISRCNFTGKLPMSLGNLTQIVSLNIWGDNHYRDDSIFLDPDTNHFSPDSFTRTSLSWICKLTKLTHLNLASFDLTGDISSWLMNLTHLINVDLSHNQLTGQIPSNFNPLMQELDLSYNNLEGPIPKNLSNLRNLDSLCLDHNRFGGSVELNLFSHLKILTKLTLSYNNLSLSINNINTKNIIPFQSLHFLGLASCNLSEFPTTLHNNKDTWEDLDLSHNNLRGHIPPWISDLGQTTEYGLSLNLSYNLLTGFEQDNPLFHPRTKIRTLDLRHNMLQGSLPIPPPSLHFSSYLISNNSFSGQVSHLFCNLTSLEHLDLSFNSLSGKLPQCLSNFSDSLSLLALKGNRFDGNIPSAWTSKCKLRMISMSYNQLQGKLPRSLGNCSSLEFIDFGNNKITDTFPLWLERITQLSVLILGSNRLHGMISDGFGFSNLRVINLSNNRFSGKMPSKFIETSNPMRALNASHMMGYMEQALLPSAAWEGEDFGQFDYAMTINNKGLERSYLRIPDIFCAIDFSSNNFEGQIPDVYGHLTGLQMLNLSRNHLSGPIPSSFSNMKNLESLDLSRNRLSGNVPTGLTKLTSLSKFDVSYNNLSGPIPQGNQFCTFDPTSFEGNLGLFVEPWNKQCGNARSLPQPQQPPSPTEEEEEDSESDLKIKWMIISIGFVCGLVVGVILGNELIARKQYWFVKTLARIGIR